MAITFAIGSYFFNGCNKLILNVHAKKETIHKAVKILIVFGIILSAILFVPSLLSSTFLAVNPLILIGIPIISVAVIFKIFSQIDVRNNQRSGSLKIGLSSGNELKHLYKRSIKLTSVEKEETVCIISLDNDLPLESGKAGNIFPENYYDLMGMHVLVVEDNPINQMLLRMMMKTWQNTNVTFSSNGAESIEALKSNAIDIILMDLQMPVMDGYEATSAIRNGNAGATNTRVPIIVVTADIMVATRERLFKLGADDFMIKPFNQKLLYQKITNLLSR